MAGTIGAISCTFVRGCLPPLRAEADVWRVAGIDGYGIHLLGDGDAAGRLLVSLLSNDAGVDTWAAFLHALQGEIVTVVNDHGDTTTNVFLAAVGNLRKSAAYQPGGAVTTRGEIEIEAIVTA